MQQPNGRALFIWFLYLLFVLWSPFENFVKEKKLLAFYSGVKPGRHTKKRAQHKHRNEIRFYLRSTDVWKSNYVCNRHCLCTMYAHACTYLSYFSVPFSNAVERSIRPNFKIHLKLLNLMCSWARFIAISFQKSIKTLHFEWAVLQGFNWFGISRLCIFQLNFTTFLSCPMKSNWNILANRMFRFSFNFAEPKCEKNNKQWTS